MHEGKGVRRRCVARAAKGCVAWQGRGGGHLRVNLFHELDDEVDELVLVHVLEVVVSQQEGNVVALRCIGAAAGSGSGSGSG